MLFFKVFKSQQWQASICTSKQTQFKAPSWTISHTDPPDIPGLSDDRSSWEPTVVRGGYICPGSSQGLSTPLSIIENVLEQMEAWGLLCILSDALDIKRIPGTIISYSTCHIVATEKKSYRDFGGGEELPMK